jgi:hypothetical protein
LQDYLEKEVYYGEENLINWWRWFL